MVGDSNVARRNGIQYHEDGVDCACYECEIKRLRSYLTARMEWAERVAKLAGHSDTMSWPHETTIENFVTEAKELLADAGKMIDHTSDAMLARRDRNRVAAQPHEAAINDWLARIKIVLRT